KIEGEVAKSAVIEGDVIIEKGAKVLHHAVVKGPAYIGRNVVIGDHSLVRESMIEEGAVIGFGSEVVRSLIGPNSKIHHCFLGDSVIGEACSLGFGTVAANKKLNRSNIKASVKGNKIDTKRSALGCIVGDKARTGVNVSLMPGAILGKESFVGPGTVFKGVLDDKKMAYVKQEVVVK
ncbi:MAG: hypothetical protein GOV00_04375, partial [Candidatus Altiarchaeota archaeon]|nr:hypothetical protein [Candidatus Altiarchaeota archaeon]